MDRIHTSARTWLAIAAACQPAAAIGCNSRAHHAGDCPPGCIDREYWYFQTQGAACRPEQVGDYSKVFEQAGNCFRLTGAPLWEVPQQIETSSVAPTPPTRRIDGRALSVSRGANSEAVRRTR
jgi:hypothetical protein